MNAEEVLHKLMKHMGEIERAYTAIIADPFTDRITRNAVSFERSVVSDLIIKAHEYGYEEPQAKSNPEILFCVMYKIRDQAVDVLKIYSSDRDLARITAVAKMHISALYNEVLGDITILEIHPDANAESEGE